MAARYGLIGLAVMGENLALNIEQHGFPIAVYNRTAERTRRFAEGEAKGKQITPTYSIAEFVGALEHPRRIILMVQAGRAVDAVLDELRPHLQPGDVVIDGGNSLFVDTQRRCEAMAAAGINYFGMGVSGGEEGARWGPSIMPGGPREAYPELEPMVTKIAAQVADGPCVTYIGPGGSGHYVKMVHNGIEYGDMQLIAETYNIMKQGLGLSAGEMSEVFKEWDRGPLNSYLIEIAGIVLAYVDPETGQPLVDLILDEAEQKGTGRWTAQSALELGVPIPTIDAAVWSRTMSSMKELRVAAAKVLRGPSGAAQRLDRTTLLPALADALYAAKISSYAQGMALLRAASDEYGFGIQYAEIARIWKGGCIIRARLLNDIQQAYKRNPDLPNLMLDEAFAEAVNARQDAWRQVVQVARQLGVPCPALSASLDYYESLRSERLPANLVQAQRDYFGAHTYRRIDKDGVFHTQWEPKRTS
ncbi:MAG TPA: NADP-dependent phosphogluconate dehydrogenase [Chloroflexota bacterium]|nr:NADP-dependent phosphogluconate dehydrogenase [Chloroflexota bacterium]